MGGLRYMPPHKPIGRFDFFTNTNYGYYIGKCKSCHQNYYISVEEAREFVVNSKLAQTEKESVFDRIKLPKIKLGW